MDGTLNSILADDLYARLGTASAPIVLDVRRRDADDRVIVSAAHCDVTRERQWLDGLAAAKVVVVYCADGGEISLGLSANFPNDHEMLAYGMVIHDALYTWCRSLQSETHNWPARTAALLE